MGASTEILTILVGHMIESTQPLGLVVWSNTSPPKSNYMVLLGNLTS